MHGQTRSDTSATLECATRHYVGPEPRKLVVRVKPPVFGGEDTAVRVVVQLHKGDAVAESQAEFDLLDTTMVCYSVLSDACQLVALTGFESSQQSMPVAAQGGPFEPVESSLVCEIPGAIFHFQHERPSSRRPAGVILDLFLAPPGAVVEGWRRYRLRAMTHELLDFASALRSIHELLDQLHIDWTAE